MKRPARVVARYAAVSLYVVAALAALGGCEDPLVSMDGGIIPASGLCRMPNGVVCSGGNAYRCAEGDAGTARLIQRCAAAETCVTGMGCRACFPNERSCNESGAPQVCSADGTTFTPEAACTGDTACSHGRCVNLCDEARMNNSYSGCEYWAVPTLNASLGGISQNPEQPASQAGAVGVNGFEYAVVVANSFQVPATVRISGGGLTAEMTQVVPPRMLVTIRLPWVNATAHVQQRGQRMPDPFASVLAARAAYHITSNVPLSAYQFNPLSFRDTTRSTCALDDQTCYSYTNDASLLLPAHVLTGNYVTMAYGSQLGLAGAMPAFFSPGFVAIVGTAPNTTVSVRLTSHTFVGPGVPEQGAPGMTITKTLGPGDVLELVGAYPAVSATTCMRERLFSDPRRPMIDICQPLAQADLTGSIVTASAPVAVFGGHNCAFVPFNRFACDHLEEQLFPSEALGTSYVLSGTVPQLSRPEPTLVRFLSNAANNTLTFTPPLMGAQVTLQRGQYVDMQLTGATEVTGTGPFAVAQYLVGQNYHGNDAALPAGTVGDPSMVLEVPTQQWRSSYDFLTPSTYTSSFVNIVAPADAQVRLDNEALSPMTPGISTIALGSRIVYRVNLSSRPGPHHVESENNQRFSVKVYGFGSYTSYMYPGGLDLTRISPPG